MALLKLRQFLGTQVKSVWSWYLARQREHLEGERKLLQYLTWQMPLERVKAGEQEAQLALLYSTQP